MTTPAACEWKKGHHRFRSYASTKVSDMYCILRTEYRRLSVTDRASISALFYVLPGSKGSYYASLEYQEILQPLPPAQHIIPFSVHMDPFHFRLIISHKRV